MKRFVWTPRNVSHTKLPQMAIRSYIEQRELTGILGDLPGLEAACEIGAGYGRMTVVLRDHVINVTACEREPEMVKLGRKLLPDIRFEQVEKLTRLPLEDLSVDLAMTFTVLQHMSHENAAKVLAEARRICRRFVLLVEDTDPSHCWVAKDNATHFTLGRSVSQYRCLMGEEWRLRTVVRREVEGGFGYAHKPRPYVGHYMLFERTGA
jgi:ubiquinone/menaquinone biosynthesis C-methylase UbiE